MTDQKPLTETALFRKKVVRFRSFCDGFYAPAGPLEQKREIIAYGRVLTLFEKS